MCIVSFFISGVLRPSHQPARSTRKLFPRLMWKSASEVSNQNKWKSRRKRRVLRAKPKEKQFKFGIDLGPTTAAAFKVCFSLACYKSRFIKIKFKRFDLRGADIILCNAVGEYFHLQFNRDIICNRRPFSMSFVVNNFPSDNCSRGFIWSRVPSSMISLLIAFVSEPQKLKRVVTWD